MKLCDDYGRDSSYCKHCSESAFDKSSDEEMSEMSSKEYPVPVGKKKRGKEGGKLTPPATKKLQMQLVDEMFLFFYWHWRKIKQQVYKKLQSHLISEYNAMHKYFIPFNECF